MISNHYPMTYGHRWNWVVLLAIVVITALSRQYFILRHARVRRPAIIGAAAAATVLLAVLVAPRPAPDAPADVAAAALAPRAQAIIRERCASCHAAEPTDDAFAAAPGGVKLETVAQMQQWAPRIRARSVASHAMPLMNRTGMTEAERAIVGAWIDAGAASN